MDINDLKLFARAAELGNITHAASDMGYTQSAASHALRRLEQNLGIQLFQRLHMGVGLTKNGKELLPYVSAMLAAQEQLLQKAADLGGSVSGVVPVGCISSVAIRWLPVLIERMAACCPSVQIRFQDGDYEAVEEWILKKKVEVGFLSASPRQSFHLTPLMEDDMLLVLPALRPSAVPAGRGIAGMPAGGTDHCSCRRHRLRCGKYLALCGMHRDGQHQRQQRLLCADTGGPGTGCDHPASDAAGGL